MNTFSKKSQLDMRDKYFKLLKYVSININISKIPYFSIFLVIFYHLLLCLSEVFNKCVFGLKVNRNGFHGGNDFLNISYN